MTTPPRVSIAVFGLSGVLGESVLRALQSLVFSARIKYPIKAVSRAEIESTSSIEYIQSDLTNSGELSSILEGTDVIIELLGPSLETFGALEEIVALVGPKLFIPSQFGADMDEVHKYAPGFIGMKAQHSKIARSAGVKVVDLYAGVIAVPGSYLYEIVGAVGIDTNSKTYSVIGDVNQKFSCSKTPDIANSIAALATATSISNLPNLVSVYSELITPQIVISTYEKNHKIKLTKNKSSTAEEELEIFRKDWAKGWDPSKFLYYIHVFISQGLNKGLYFEQNGREYVNPGESLWKWEKY